ncbi:MAG: nitroreductase [Geminicoccaceae bacterium]
MDALEAILSRTTVPQARMTDPGPDDAALTRLLACAMAAPDHGRLRPWRLLLIRGAARERLGALFERCLLADLPAAAEADRRKAREAPLRAPLIIVVIAQIRSDQGKIPGVEQIASAAALAQNVLIAAHAMGFAGKWSTGPRAYDPRVREALGLAQGDALVGFLYLGSHAGPVPEPGPRPAPHDLAEDWTGAAI